MYGNYTVRTFTGNPADTSEHAGCVVAVDADLAAAGGNDDMPERSSRDGCDSDTSNTQYIHSTYTVNAQFIHNAYTVNTQHINSKDAVNA